MANLFRCGGGNPYLKFDAKAGGIFAMKSDGTWQLIMETSTLPLEFIPFDFITNTIVSDWNKTGGSVVIDNKFTYASGATSAYYATYNETVPVKMGATLNCVGTITWSTTSISGSSYIAYAGIQISKDGGASWATVISTSVASEKNVISTTANVSQTADLSAFAGYDCMIRAYAYQTRGSTASTSTLTLTEFKISY